MSRVAAVVIGRNEGARLLRCFDSLRGRVKEIIYVDSGSQDGSVGEAEKRKIKVVRLDPDQPFTAARARGEGFNAVQDADFIQFVDGDCGVEPDWISRASGALEQDEALGLVTGWRTEISPETSVYNALCDFEWHRPAGEILTCGGDMMVRRKAYEAAGGFNPQVIAAEDDEFCVRLRKAGWGLRRLPEAMTRHDAAMTRFSAWWRRAVRSGHGFAQVGHLHPDYFVTERRRVLVYGGLLPALGIVALATMPWAILVILALYALSYVKAWRGLVRAGMGSAQAAHHSVFLTLSKLPNIIGMGVFHWRRMTGAAMKIIEYK